MQQQVDKPSEQEAEAYLAPWKFQSIGDLRRALQEYTALLGENLTQHYGERDGGDDTSGDDDYVRSVLRWRSAIDGGMGDLEETRPAWYRLLDMYYRHGACLDPKGWLLPMMRMGYRKVRCPALHRCTIPRGPELEDKRHSLPKCKSMTALHCRSDWDAFEVQLALAITALFYAIEDRQERTLDT